MQLRPEHFKKIDEKLLNIPPVEIAVPNIKDLIEDWETWADKYKIEPPGERICPESPEVK